MLFCKTNQDLSATSEFDPETLSQMTPMSTFKTAGHSNNLELLDQVTPRSSMFLGGQTSENPPADATPHKLPAAHVVVISTGQDDITPAKGSSSKRVKLIKQEKK